MWGGALNPDSLPHVYSEWVGYYRTSASRSAGLKTALLKGDVAGLGAIETSGQPLTGNGHHPAQKGSSPRANLKDHRGETSINSICTSSFQRGWGKGLKQQNKRTKGSVLLPFEYPKNGQGHRWAGGPRALFILQAATAPLHPPTAPLPPQASPGLTAQPLQPRALLQPLPPWPWLPSIPCSECTPPPQRPHRAALLWAQLPEGGNGLLICLLHLSPPPFPHTSWVSLTVPSPKQMLKNARVEEMTEFSVAGKYTWMMCQRKFDYRIFQGQGFLWKWPHLEVVICTFIDSVTLCPWAPALCQVPQVFQLCRAILSHFSRVWLFATPWTVAHQVPLSMGFSRQEYWSVLPCPPPSSALFVVQLLSPVRLFGTPWTPACFQTLRLPSPSLSPSVC